MTWIKNNNLFHPCLFTQICLADFTYSHHPVSRCLHMMCVSILLRKRMLPGREHSEKVTNIESNIFSLMKQVQFLSSFTLIFKVKVWALYLICEFLVNGELWSRLLLLLLLLPSNRKLYTCHPMAPLWILYSEIMTYIFKFTKLEILISRKHFQGKTSFYAFAIKIVQWQWILPADLPRLARPTSWCCSCF